MDILLAHEHVAFEAEARCDGSAGNPVLAGPGFRNDAFFAHVLGQQRLANRIVYLVRTGVIQILPLEEYPGASDRIGHAAGFVQG